MPEARQRLLAASQCPEVVAAGNAYLTSTESAAGNHEWALIGSNVTRRFGTPMKLAWKATPVDPDGLLVVGWENADSEGPETFVHLDGEGREICREDRGALTARVAQAPDTKLEFYGLFEGAAIFLENSGGPASPSEHYALFPCRPALPLGSCRSGESPDWQGGPVCLGERTFRVLGDGASGKRLSPEDRGYSASRDGVLRIQQIRPARFLLSWVDRRPGRGWQQSVDLSAVAEVASAAASADGAALWLLPPSSERGGRAAAELLILSRTGSLNRRAVEIERGGMPRVVVGADGWGAAVPMAAEEAQHVVCWFLQGRFPT